MCYSLINNYLFFFFVLASSFYLVIVISPTAIICDKSYSSPWAYFARYILGLQLCKYLSISSFLICNSLPHSFKLSHFYSSLLPFVDDLFSLFSSPNCSTQSIYRNISSRKSVSPICELSWIAAVGKDHEWKNTCLNSCIGLSSGLKNDVLWKIYYRVRKTASNLKSWGLRISGLYDLCSVV